MKSVVLCTCAQADLGFVMQGASRMCDAAEVPLERAFRTCQIPGLLQLECALHDVK